MFMVRRWPGSGVLGFRLLEFNVTFSIKSMATMFTPIRFRAPSAHGFRVVMFKCRFAVWVSL